MNNQYFAKEIGHVVEDYYNGDTRIIICDDNCEKDKNKIQDIEDSLSLFIK